VPIRDENRARYPSNWKALALAIKQEVRWCCEWCPAEHGKSHPVTGSKVVLTIAHLDHQPEDCIRSNLKALCQRCHNTTDVAERQRGLEQRRRARLGVVDLPL
jgi:5-methylcytosine-specific restriction endonuclease McrA